MRSIARIAGLLCMLAAGTTGLGQSPVAPPAAPPAVHADAGPLYLPLTLRHGAPLKVLPDRGAVFGVQLSEVRFRDPQIVADAHAAGAAVWRTFLFWDEVEPVRTDPPSYDWRHYDPLFAAADRLGLTVIAEIQGNPAWAADTPGGPPHDFDSLAGFLAAAVERYDGDGDRDAPGRPKVRYWELYNEPDNTDPTLAVEGRGWGFWGHVPAEYARMLKRVYPVVKLASPRAQVVFGGIAHDNFVPDGGPFNPAFTDDVLRAGAGPYFDVMNFHYYPTFADRWSAWGVGLVGKTTAVRRKLAAHGLDKPIMVTEAGMWSAAEPPYAPATPADQSRYVAQLYAQALAARVEVVIWFQYDDVAGFDDPARGLVDRDLTSKPARTAYRVASEMLAGALPDARARDATAPGEVYWFARGDERVGVAWTNDGSQARLTVRAPSVEWVQTLGNRHVVRDASDGRLDGVTLVPYGPDPVFVRVPAGSGR